LGLAFKGSQLEAEKNSEKGEQYYAKKEFVSRGTSKIPSGELWREIGTSIKEASGFTGPKTMVG